MENYKPYLLSLKKSVLKLLQQKKIAYPLAGFGILLLLFCLWGGYFFSKSSVLDRYLTARSQSNVKFEDIKEYLVWDDTNQVIASDEASYTKFSPVTSKSKQEELRIKLLTATPKDNMYLKSVGRRFGIFPDYRIALKPLSLTVKTNLSGVDILLNQKKIATSDSDNYTYTVDHLPAADYTFSLDGQHNGKAVELSKAYNGKDKTIDLSVSFKNFTVRSNLKDGDLYFGKKRIASLSNGEYQVSDYPADESVSVYVRKTFSDGKLSSSKEVMKNVTDGAVLQLDAEGVLDEAGANQLLQAAFSKFSTFATSGQDASDLAATFEDGSANGFYQALKESIKQKTQLDSRKPSSLTISAPSLTSLNQVGLKTYQLGYSVSYTYYYDESTDKDKKTSGNLIQTYSGQLQLKRTDSGFQIAKSGHQEHQLIAEDNQVKRPDPIPEELVGTWETKKDGDTITISLTSDGTVTKKIDYKDEKKEDSTKTAKVSQAEELSDGLYRYHFESGDKAAFTVLDDIGANDAYVYGLRLNGSTLTTVYWKSGNTDGSPETGLSLTKK
ncbi:zinc ribbon domain-containing protein [Streptococcus ferus]|uniref:zinc ribbon domain-containing protein n=1 Tax=Streptococcus ferus TaxID=1345 RepID=UPI00359F60DE